MPRSRRHSRVTTGNSFLERVRTDARAAGILIGGCGAIGRASRHQVTRMEPPARPFVRLCARADRRSASGWAADITIVPIHS